MNWDDFKFLAIAAFVVYLIIFYAFEFPIFGIVLLISILALLIWWLIYEKVIWPKEQEKQEELNKIYLKEQLKEEKQKEKREKDLLDKLSKEIDSIIENNIKIIAAAYRTSVTSNSFGKKNYNKFILELADFIEDNSKVLEEARAFIEVNYDNAEINFVNDSVIEAIEEQIEELNQNVDYTDDIDPFEYEHFCAEEFKKNGWVAEATQGSSDQGVDVKASKGGIDLVAQCKRFSKPVGNKAVQEVVAGIKYYAANKGIVIAPNGFTKSAKKLAESNNIDLIHHSEIKDL